MPDEQAQEAQRHHYGRIHRPVSSRQGEVVERCRSSYANGRSRGARAGGEGSLVAPVGPAELHGGVAWAARHCGAETCLSELLERSGGRAVLFVGRLIGAVFPGGPRPSRDLRCRAGRQHAPLAWKPGRKLEQHFRTGQAEAAARLIIRTHSDSGAGQLPERVARATHVPLGVQQQDLLICGPLDRPTQRHRRGRGGSSGDARIQ
mmetsp:Transcript_21651/g.67918  ORF Transcript_21651/g.67918 Transcript_21651/m.67918 type:complete len:205 (+) Transcript_21651:432-1046(+)